MRAVWLTSRSQPMGGDGVVQLVHYIDQFAWTAVSKEVYLDL